MKQCCILVTSDGDLCDRPAVCSIDWPDGGGATICWYCAEHYDQKIAEITVSGRIALLKETGVK